MMSSCRSGDSERKSWKNTPARSTWVAMWVTWLKMNALILTRASPSTVPGCLEPLERGLVDLLDDGEEEVLLGVDVVVEAALQDAELVGDVLDRRRLVALLLEQAGRGRDHLLLAAERVAGSASGRARLLGHRALLGSQGSTDQMLRRSSISGASLQRPDLHQLHFAGQPGRLLHCGHDSRRERLSLPLVLRRGVFDSQHNGVLTTGTVDDHLEATAPVDLGQARLDLLRHEEEPLDPRDVADPAEHPSHPGRRPPARTGLGVEPGHDVAGPVADHRLGRPLGLGGHHDAGLARGDRLSRLGVEELDDEVGVEVHAGRGLALGRDERHLGAAVDLPYLHPAPEVLHPLAQRIAAQLPGDGADPEL